LYATLDRAELVMITPKDNYPQLLSLAAHEFRTPVSVAGGYLRMLQRDTDAPLTERQRKMVEEAEKSCTRLVDLIAELNEISKIDAGLVTLARQPVDIFALVADLAARANAANDRELHLEIQGEEMPAMILGDAARLRSAFDALIRSIQREQATPATVVVERRRVTRDGRRLAVIVVSEKAHVQAAYERTARAFDEQRGGLGLQLPLARRVIEGHGGHLVSPAAVTPPGVDDPVARGSVIISLPITE
jgi:signal transduction histidine kinase